jgi:hypothetical protein
MRISVLLVDRLAYDIQNVLIHYKILYIPRRKYSKQRLEDCAESADSLTFDLGKQGDKHSVNRQSRSFFSKIYHFLLHPLFIDSK